jgi:proteasome lid subunit RPN8/RPN11
MGQASLETRSADLLILGTALRDRLIATAVARFPLKTFGYLLARDDPLEPVDFVIYRDNIRNDVVWRDRFEAYGRYFVDHSDAGFVATPQESWDIQQEIARRDLVEVGVFHTHQRHPANFSRIDFDLHRRLFVSLYHVIISLRNPAFPRLRAFRIGDDGVRELQVDTEAPARISPC